MEISNLLLVKKCNGLLREGEKGEMRSSGRKIILKKKKKLEF